MILAPASDDFEWDDEEASYYDDEVINVDDNESSCDIMCIERKRLNPLEFNIVDGRVVIGGKALEVDASEYLRRYQTLGKEIQELLCFQEFYEYDIGILFRNMYFIGNSHQK